MQTKAIYLGVLILILLSCKTRYHYDERVILKNKSVDKIKSVLDTERLEAVTDINGIPKKAIKFLNRIDIDHERFRIVNPGMNYQANDIFTGEPSRRLIVIVKNKKYFIMTYEHGGRGRHAHILYFEFNKNKIVDFWVGFGAGENTKEIRSFLDNESELQTNIVQF